MGRGGGGSWHDGRVTDPPRGDVHRDARGATGPRWGLVAIVALALAALAVGVGVATLPRGGGGSGDPVLAPATSEVAGTAGAQGLSLPGCAGPERAGVEPFDGFGETAFRVAAADGTTAFDGCAHLAATPAARGQGLMARRSLGGHDAMVFRFDEPGTGAFYMYRTVLPLSIAFIGEDGEVVSTTDMEPCGEEEPSACPTYPPAGPYLHAIEVRQGDLPRLGIVPGATVTFDERRR